MSTQTEAGNGKTELVKVHPAKRFEEMALARAANLERSTPSGIDYKRLQQVAVQIIARSPQLAECTPESLLMAFAQGTELGLEFSPALGQAYFVPFWNGKMGRKEAQFIPGYRGLIALARRSGFFSGIEARVVRGGDTFDYSLGLHPDIHHSPGDGCGEVTHAYAIAWPIDGSKPHFDVMTRGELDRIKARSKSKNKQGEITGPWRDDEAEMQRKTVVRRLFKYLPANTEMSKALAADDDSPEYSTVENMPSTSIKSRLEEHKRLRHDETPAAVNDDPVGDAAEQPASEPSDAAEPTPEKPAAEPAKLPWLKVFALKMNAGLRDAWVKHLRKKYGDGNPMQDAAVIWNVLPVAVQIGIAEAVGEGQNPPEAQ